MLKVRKEKRKGDERHGSTGNKEELWEKKRELIDKEEEDTCARKRYKSSQTETKRRDEEEKSWIDKIKEEWKIGIKEIKKVKEIVRGIRIELEEMPTQGNAN